MTYLPFLTLLAPIVGFAVVLITGHYGTRNVRAEQAAEEAARDARAPKPHATR